MGKIQLTTTPRSNAVYACKYQEKLFKPLWQKTFFRRAFQRIRRFGSVYVIFAVYFTLGISIMDLNSVSISHVVIAVVAIAGKELISFIVKLIMDRIKGTLTHMVNRHLIMVFVDLGLIAYFIYSAFLSFYNDHPAVKSDLLLLGYFVLAVVLFGHALMDDMASWIKAYFSSKREAEKQAVISDKNA